VRRKLWDGSGGTDARRNGRGLWDSTRLELRPDLRGASLHVLAALSLAAPLCRVSSPRVLAGSSLPRRGSVPLSRGGRRGLDGGAPEASEVVDERPALLATSGATEGEDAREMEVSRTRGWPA